MTEPRPFRLGTQVNPTTTKKQSSSPRAVPSPKKQQPRALRLADIAELQLFDFKKGSGLKNSDTLPRLTLPDVEECIAHHTVEQHFGVPPYSPEQTAAFGKDIIRGDGRIIVPEPIPIPAKRANVNRLDVAATIGRHATREEMIASTEYVPAPRVRVPKRKTCPAGVALQQATAGLGVGCGEFASLSDAMAWETASCLGRKREDQSRSQSQGRKLL